MEPQSHLGTITQELLTLPQFDGPQPNRFSVLATPSAKWVNFRMDYLLKRTKGEVVLALQTKQMDAICFRYLGTSFGNRE